MKEYDWHRRDKCQHIKRGDEAVDRSEECARDVEPEFRVNETALEANTKASEVERCNAEALAEIARKALADAVRKGDRERALFETMNGLLGTSLSRMANLQWNAPLKKEEQEVEVRKAAA